MPGNARIWLCSLLLAVLADAQTTQGVISGQVFEGSTGRTIANADVHYNHLESGGRGATRTNPSGFYALTGLSPGTYELRVVRPEYQTLETSEVRLFVAGRVEIDFPLRQLRDVYGEKSYFNGAFALLRGQPAFSSGRVIHFYAADVETTRSAVLPVLGGEAGAFQAAVSYVIDSKLLQDLPLFGRDAYTTLATLAGVSSDAPTARSLGLAVNGQRPSSSNFLLDGLEYNNYLVTGPLAAVAPEALQEYRISTNSFSAEYGRTGGYLANAVTRSGGNAWHGTGYFYFRNEVLNANDFQRNFNGQPRAPLRAVQPGFQAGGPLRKNTLFASAAFEYLRTRNRLEPAVYRLPTASIQPTGSLARELLQAHPPPPVTPGRILAGSADCLTASTPTCGEGEFSAPSSLDRYLFLPRVDYLVKESRHRLMGRASVVQLDRPDFIWTPYKDFVTPLEQNAVSLAGAWTATLRPQLMLELRGGWSTGTLQFERAKPEIPLLLSRDAVTLPGSPAFYGYRNESRGSEFLGNVAWIKGRHISKLGGGVVIRGLDGFLTARRDQEIEFLNLQAFSADRPIQATVALERSAWPKQRLIPRYDRRYGFNQFFLFFQDSFKVMPRLVLNYGVRYENFGAPRNTGANKDATVVLGDGADFPQRIQAAGWVYPTAGEQQLYQSDGNDWAFRGGFSYALREDARALLRGAYGVYYDRPFDNLWQNLRNNSVLIAGATPPEGFNYLAPVEERLLMYTAIEPDELAFPAKPVRSRTTLFQADIRNPYVHSFFLGALHQFTPALVLEVNGLGSLGRKLITTDVVNRRFSVGFGDRFNNTLPDLAYRANQGLSSHYALSTVLRYRAPRALLQLSYTLGHTIDNQSEPLAGDYFNLGFTQGSQPAVRQSTFTRQFDSSADRGDSDFDQRQNLAFFSTWDLPAFYSGSRAAPLWNGWRFALLGAIRAGLPFTVYAPTSFDPLPDNRANLKNPDLVAADQPAPGGRLLLNSTAFERAARNVVGNSGRNAFRGPGFFSLDLSLARSFPFRSLGDGGRLTLRADAYNLLNHANLNSPQSNLNFGRFGVGLYGLEGRSTGFPGETPFRETARQIQLLLRVEF